MRLRELHPGFVRDHLWVRRHLAGYLDGELEAPARKRVERHAHLCPKCRRLVATLVRTLEALRDLREPATAAPSGSVSATVIARLREEPHPPAPPHFPDRLG